MAGMRMVPQGFRQPSSSPGPTGRNRYQEVRSIGRGSFGEATLAKDSAGNLCVMKTIDITRLNREEQQEAVNEVKVLSSLKHPYIVRYHESFIENGTLAIVMDYAEGGDLSKRIKSHRDKQQLFAEGQIVRWFTQIALGLKYMHKRHILHRDLKPGNIFLTKWDDLRLGDFGISVVGSSSVKEKETIGTPYYLSPEICHEKLYSFASDIWALGCILYELAALHVPFEAMNIPGLIHKITSGKLPGLPAAFSTDMRQLCHELLCHDYNRRPSAVDVLSRPMIQTEMRQMLAQKSDAGSSSNASSSPPLSRGSLTKGLADPCERRALGSRPFLKPLESNLELKHSPSAPAVCTPTGLGNMNLNALSSSNAAATPPKKRAITPPKRLNAWGCPDASDMFPKADPLGCSKAGGLGPKHPSEPSLLSKGDVFSKGAGIGRDKFSGPLAQLEGRNLNVNRSSPNPLLLRKESLGGDMPNPLLARGDMLRKESLGCDKFSDALACNKLNGGGNFNVDRKRACQSPLGRPIGMVGGSRCGATRRHSHARRRQPAMPVWQDIAIH